MVAPRTVTWDVDPAQSLLRMDIPDFAYTLVSGETTYNLTVLIRNANNSAWSDSGGKMARLDGEIVTEDVSDFDQVKFVTGMHDLYALEETNLRPNPAAFDPNNTSTANPYGQYSGTGTALAAWGGKVRAAYKLSGFPITIDLAYLAFRGVDPVDLGVDLDIASDYVAIDGFGQFAGSQSTFGIETALLDVDGLNIVLVGQPIPDLLHEPLSGISETNTAGGMIEDLGGLDRKLTYNINIPLLFVLDDVTISGTATGKIVAYATVPEPSTLALLAVGAVLMVLRIGTSRRFGLHGRN
ncbi:MAG: PEP-CTERM sorting domain-containing protein [Planctomycetia bacterium]|nr:PEP-CTERM sorting domain-containing protein [Planctomycetia bacterium]